jgi:hypothetical protein
MQPKEGMSECKCKWWVMRKKKKGGREGMMGRRGQRDCPFVVG